MATISNTGSTTNYFSGSSVYSAQLQQSIARALTIASLPVKELQNQQTALTGKQAELHTLSSTFAAMQAAVESLHSSTGVGAFSAGVSDNTVASASISAGVLSGNYTLNVTSIGSQTNAVSAAGLQTVADPATGNIDSSSNLTLSVNGKDYQIANTGGTLTSLAQAITSSSANVQASVVNVGSSAAPDYRLSIQSLDYAPDTLQLTDDSHTDLLQTVSTGSNVTYQVNGQPSTPITSTTRSATVSTGLSVQILKTGSTEINVAQSISGIASALSSFATAYNAITGELSKNRGQNGGALTGDSVVFQLQTALRNLTNFTPANGSVKSLASLGLTFDLNGTLNFDASALQKSATSSAGDVLNFIGSSTSGGFLQTATQLIASVTDTSTGSLAQASKIASSRISTLASKISANQTHITELQATLTARMATADATISSLQDQLTQVTGLFAQMQVNSRANAQ